MKLWLCAGTLVVPLCFLAHHLSASQTAAAVDDSFDGRIEPARSVLVAAPKDGILVEVSVDVGSVVSAGDVLARLDARADELALALADTRASAKSDELRARATIEDIDARIARRAPLYDEQLLPSAERDELAQHRRVAEVDLVSAAEKTKLAELDVQRARFELERDRVVAPLSGVVVERFLSPGEWVGRAQPGVVRIAALDPLRVEATLPLRLLDRVHVGDLAWVRAENEAGRERQARVLAVARAVDTASATFVVRLELENHDLALPAGLRCRVRFTP